MSTEIQRVPGNFKLPSGWPKLVIPDTTSGLYADFDASALSTGPLGTAWRSVAGTPVPFTLSPRVNPANPSNPPVVSTDGNGNKRLVFDGANRLDSSPAPATAMPPLLTLLVTFRPTWWTDPAGGGHIRLVTGAPDYRGIQLDSANPGRHLVVSNYSSPVAIAPNLPLGQIMQTAGRFSASAVTGNVYGSAAGKATATAAATNTTYFHVGASTSNPLAAGFKGDIYRIQMWSRVLNDTDLAAAMAENADRYNIPNPGN